MKDDFREAADPLTLEQFSLMLESRLREMSDRIKPIAGKTFQVIVTDNSSESRRNIACRRVSKPAFITEERRLLVSLWIKNDRHKICAVTPYGPWDYMLDDLKDRVLKLGKAAEVMPDYAGPLDAEFMERVVAQAEGMLNPEEKAALKPEQLSYPVGPRCDDQGDQINWQKIMDLDALFGASPA
jgi:hypothetical protein